MRRSPSPRESRKRSVSPATTRSRSNGLRPLKSPRCPQHGPPPLLRRRRPRRRHRRSPWSRHKLRARLPPSRHHCRRKRSKYPRPHRHQSRCLRRHRLRQHLPCRSLPRPHPPLLRCAPRRWPLHRARRRAPRAHSRRLPEDGRCRLRPSPPSRWRNQRVHASPSCWRRMRPTWPRAIARRASSAPATVLTCCWVTSPIVIQPKHWRAACVQCCGRTLSSIDTEGRVAGAQPLRAATRLAVLVLALALAACSSAPSKRGGFYQDDGPPEKAPADLSRTADAVPRIEPFHPYANRPYTALGRSYKPITDDRPYRARGLASWYGKQFHGSRTSSGEIYDMFAASAAHPTLPIPSYARVTNTRTGAVVIVRVNDRGPFKSNRVIDLSYAAAVKIGIAAAGTGEVEVVRLTFDDIRAMRGEGPRADPPPVAEPSVAPPTQAESGRWSVQVGAFQQEANADALRENVAVQLQQSGGELATQRPPRVERDGSIFRVLVGAVADRAAAQSLAQQLERLLGRETTLL